MYCFNKIPISYVHFYTRSLNVLLLCFSFHIFELIIEAEARGILAKSLYNLHDDLGLSKTSINSILERTSKAYSYKFPSL